MPSLFKLKSPWAPSGDQGQAIDKLSEGFEKGLKYQTLMGVTGSGKTFTVANVIQKVQRPTLILAHNKTLAAQLYSEFRDFFPDNAVHYFVSYYDYYQPEAYVPSSDTYIEKDASVNDRIEKLRLAATKALIEREDVIVVASVSCIYGLGKKKTYEEAVIPFSVGEIWDRRTFLESLMAGYYSRNDVALSPGNFRVRGDVVEIFPAYSDTCLRVVFFDDEIESIEETDPVSGKTVLRKERAAIYPAQHYVTTDEAVAGAMKAISEEMRQQVDLFTSQGKFIEAQRIESRTRYDMEMLVETGYCSGIENYSRYMDGRSEGEPPGTLIDFFPDDFLLVVDESHITLPQVRGMFNGDRARKETLVNHGFRLPSCLDNRPLRWEEFSRYMNRTLFLSATPGDWESSMSERIVEQVIRPTGIPDPEVLIVPASGQVDDLLERLREVIGKDERALVTTLTKKGAEDLGGYLVDLGLKAKYIHSDLNTFERADLIKELRSGGVSVLVGVNLLREGMDLPEVTLVAILDADREGFLRSYRSLIQVMGRAARNVNSKVVLYADEMTDSISKAVDETVRRRELQIKYNEEHNIVPKTVYREIRTLLPEELMKDALPKGPDKWEETLEGMEERDLERLMWEAVEKLQFERAATLRDILGTIRGGEMPRVASGNSHRRRKRT
ncbi:excinuclease ABC, B subunit [Dethiosulfovibrio peptidovorans DSM 11002]|uniref:UvrABC system protein B n=1 Tax=Dethiosulfovibrio peptidovorans DSM 11002 TaxID=469381 RepID=D2Z377_9BACT|nr:excinuclease ABC subunit UvrB [Dethiosulfovibrio peptidovorans]EFC92117.1 excinuclease ABC, B subunit [Dethiosulfovibrio peptidovorans DSM 11002]